MGKAKFKIDYDGAPLLSEEELLHWYTEECVLIMDEVLMNKTNWSTTYQSMLDILKYGYERDEIRHRKIHFKFHREDEKIHELEIRHFYGNLNLWYGFVEADAIDILDESYILDFKTFTYNDIIKYIDKKIFTLPEIDNITKGKIADEIMFNVAATSRAFEDIIGIGFSVYNIIQAAEKYPIIDEIIHEEIDVNLQPVEIENILTERTNILMDALKKYPNDLRPLLVSGKNISPGQFKEIFVRLGMKADINGSLIPFVANCNFLVDGFKDAGSYYISAKSGRKASIFSKLLMGEPGAFSKKNCINTTGVLLRKDYEMCDSQVPVTYEIKDKAYLNMLDKRYYYDDEDGDKMKLLNCDTDEHLIGRKIKFRSPCTCSSTEGICKYCYGELYETNKDLASAGCYAATKETEYLGQGVLSTKHSQQTHSDAAEFTEEFDNDFEIASTEIVLKDNDDSDIDKYIIFDEVFKENDDEDEINYFVYGYKIVDAAHNVLYTVCEKNGLKLYMSKGTHDLYMKYEGKRNPAIPLEQFEDLEDESIFSIEIKSAESTEPTKLLKNLINTKAHCGLDTIDDICQKFADLKIQSGHPYNCVHHEMIIRGLLRKRSNIYEIPDFGPNGDHEDYQILRTDDAIFNNPSPFVSIYYGFLKKQLLSPQFYQKTAVSNLDPMFAPTIGDLILS